MIVVSPFLDVSTVRTLGKWGGVSVSKTIVSTEEWLSKIEIASASPLAHYQHVLAMGKPEMEADETIFGDALEEMEERATLRIAVYTQSCSESGMARVAHSGWVARTQPSAGGAERT